MVSAASLLAAARVLTSITTERTKMPNFRLNRSSLRATPLLVAALTLAALASFACSPQIDSASAKSVAVTGLVYGDNSFELYVNGRKVASDPIAF